MSDTEIPEWAERAAIDLIGKPYPYDKNMVVTDAVARRVDETRVVFDLNISPILRTEHRFVAIDFDTEMGQGFNKVVRVPEGEPVECAWCPSLIPAGAYAFFNPDATDHEHGPWAELGHRSQQIPAPSTDN